MFNFEIEPRLSETDALGHINNTVLPIWFEEARKDLFHLFNPGLKMKTWNLILKKYEIEIFYQIYHTHIVNITTTIDHIGTTSVIVNQIATQNDKTVATAKTVLIHFDYTTNTPAVIPDSIKSELKKHIT